MIHEGRKQQSLNVQINPYQNTILIDGKKYLKLHHSITECSLACYIQHPGSLDHIREDGLRYIMARLPS